MAAPVNTSVPTITAQRLAGQTITGARGSWTGASSFADQWERAHVVYDGAHVVYDGVEIVVEPWVEIGGATSLTYQLTAAENRCLIRLRVTATNVDGSTIAYSAESAIATVGGSGDFAPVGAAFRTNEEDES